MNSNNQHPMDEIIDREIRGLRNPVESKHGIGDAIMAMQNAPAVIGRIALKWPIGIGSVAVAAGAVILVTSLTTTKAFAGDIRDIASAQERQKTMHQVAYHFGGDKEPMFVTETWIDHNKEAFRQLTREGKLTFSSSSDGKRRTVYSAASSDVMASASIDVDNGSHYNIETITSYTQSDFFQKHSIEKTSGVKLNGRTCDLYNFAKGYYRIWVDPVSKLPLQREVYNKGVTLWERDVYEYPDSFSEQTFAPVAIPDLPYFDYIAARKQVQAKLDQPGVSQRVGNVTITLKGVVRDYRSVRAIWSTTGVDGWTNDRTSNFEIAGVVKSSISVEDMTAMSFAPGKGVLNEQMVMQDPELFKLPATIRVSAWEADSTQTSGKKFVGWATFTVKDVITAPYIGQLFRAPVYEGTHAAVSKAKG